MEASGVTVKHISALGLIHGFLTFTGVPDSVGKVSQDMFGALDALLP
ncbi:hypothetical protein [Candidatus Protofrankia californiensis]|nr:hypothetical protein [Candidatus Protofrankia californiensis]